MSDVNEKTYAIYQGDVVEVVDGTINPPLVRHIGATVARPVSRDCLEQPSPDDLLEAGVIEFDDPAEDDGPAPTPCPNPRCPGTEYRIIQTVRTEHCGQVVDGELHITSSTDRREMLGARLRCTTCQGEWSQREVVE